MHPVIIWGMRTRSQQLGQLMYVCPQCRNNSSHMVLQVKHLFALFFVPLFPVSTTYTAICGVCGYREKVTKEQAKSMFPNA